METLCLVTSASTSFLSTRSSLVVRAVLRSIITLSCVDKVSKCVVVGSPPSSNTSNGLSRALGKGRLKYMNGSNDTETQMTVF